MQLIPQPEAGTNKRRLTDRNFVMFWSEPITHQHIGIYTKGSRVVNPIFGLAPLIHTNLRGTCCIFREDMFDFSSDLLLQSRHLPAEQIEPALARLNLPPLEHLQSRLFESTFRANDTEEFPKTVVVLSIAADVEGMCFRNREHGFLLPDSAADNVDSIDRFEWFHAHFAPTRMTVEGFVEAFSRVVNILQKDAGARVLALNVPTISSSSRVHNYQFLEDQPGSRRLEFNLALAEMSRRLDFAVVDIDRIARNAGLKSHFDWNLLDPGCYYLVAQEAYRIMMDRNWLT